MALTDLHVNGPATVRVALNGSSYSNLGISEDGVDIQIRPFHEDITSDDYGPAMASDVQFMGAEAIIRIAAVRWDESTMRSVVGMVRSNTGGSFNMADIGTLLIAGSKYVGLNIQSSQRTGLSLESPYTFSYAFPVQEVPLKVGTRVTRMALTFRALAINGALYSRS